MSKELKVIQREGIENLIFNIRGMQVMIDSDIAQMYGVELKRLNEQVKRNIIRFPESFRFQLSETELQDLKSQIATTNTQDILKSQFATASSHGGRRTLPYAFTEQGVAMLSSVLHSEIAIQVSIQIMNAFVEMRKTIANHQQLLQLSEDFYTHRQETNQRFEQVFQALEAPKLKNKQGVFFDGQSYDAYQFVNELIKTAKQRIVLIDNYIDDTVITQLTRKNKAVKVYLFTHTISKKLKLDVEKANTQYPNFTVKNFKQAHDRFLIIDEQVYHFGASLKDLGKKWFAFSKMDADSLTIIKALEEWI